MTRPKKVIPTKSYSLAMLHHPHTTNVNHAQTRYWPSNCFIPLLSQTFSTLTQYMSVSHGHSAIGGMEYGGGCEEQGRRWSHINQAYQRAMDIPINIYQCG